MQNSRTLMPHMSHTQLLQPPPTTAHRLSIEFDPVPMRRNHSNPTPATRCRSSHSNPRDAAAANPTTQTRWLHDVAVKSEKSFTVLPKALFQQYSLFAMANQLTYLKRLL